MLQHGVQIFVPAPRKIDNQNLVWGHAWGAFGRLGDRVCGFKRRKNALELAKLLKGFQALFICCVCV